MSERSCRPNCDQLMPTTPGPAIVWCSRGGSPAPPPSAVHLILAMGPALLALGLGLFFAVGARRRPASRHGEWDCSP